MLNIRKIGKFAPLLDSGYFFSNQKTMGIAVDFRVCQLMKMVNMENGKRKFTSKTCKGCYSADILTIYKNLANKIVNLKDPSEKGQLEAFDNDCSTLNKLFPELTKLRFYALSDFHHDDIPYIKAASKYFTVDIISKALNFPHNEKYLIELFNLQNVWVSLSFNRDFCHQLDRIVDLVETHEPDNVQLNYTLNYKEENPDDEFYKKFQVFHLKNKHKRDALDKFENLTESNTCAIFSREGEPIRAHGACDSCNNCHVNYKDYQNGKRASLPIPNTTLKETA